MNEFQRYTRVLEESRKINNEYMNAKEQFPEFNSLHEGYAVVKEELEEFWEMVKLKQSKHPERLFRAREEILHTAAMCLAILVEFPLEES